MLRTTAATWAGRAIKAAAKVRGGGSALPGLVVERLDPAWLTHTLDGVREGVVVVSGTNGKTTTTRMLVAILREHGRTVVTNPTGSNFTRGVISSLLPQVHGGRVEADYAVFELDEAHALKFAEVLAPTHALILNVARDQLDRFAEIDHTAALLTTLGAAATQGVVLNRDDSYVSRIRDHLAPGVRLGWFGLGTATAHRLGELQEQDVRFADTDTAPPVGPHDGLLDPDDERAFRIEFGALPRVGPVTLQQRGLAAMINATAAATMARQLLGSEFDPQAVARALASVKPPFGRGEVVDIGGQPLELVLVKNPAGFTVALATYGSTPVATMIAINDDYADGRDVSWLYDVSFASLRDRGVAMTSGVRGWDMALRLEYDGVPVAATDTDLVAAMDAFVAAHPDEPRRIFCTYTAMMALRKVLAERHGLADFGEEG